jgi:hypothetical protein
MKQEKLVGVVNSSPSQNGTLSFYMATRKKMLRCEAAHDYKGPVPRMGSKVVVRGIWVTNEAKTGRGYEYAFRFNSLKLLAQP